MQAKIEQLEAANLQIVGVSYDSVSVLEAFASAENISLPLLSDEGSATINAYGIHNHDGLPHPGTILIDKTATIRGKIFREGYRERHPVDELIELAKTL